MSLFAFLGNDELRKQEALEAEVLAWAGPGGDCLREVHYGEDLRWEQVAESFRTADLFAPRKALVIKGWDRLHASSRERLEEAFREGNPQVAVFLSAEKWDGRSRLFKSVKEAGGIREFKLPYDNQIPAWLCQRAREKYGRRLATAEAQALQDLAGGRLEDLDHELEKLDTFLPKGQAIAAGDIEDLVSPLRMVGRFEFQKVMGFGRKADLVPALRSLLEGEAPPPFLVVQWLYGHFLTLLKIRAFLDEGRSQDEIVEALRLNRFMHIQKEGYLEQARTRSPGRWKQLLIRLARMEREMKQGRYSHRFELEMAFASMV